MLLKSKISLGEYQGHAGSYGGLKVEEGTMNALLVPEAVVSPFSRRVEVGEALEIRDLDRMSTHSKISCRSCSGRIGLLKPVGQSQSALAAGSDSLFQANLSQIGSGCMKAGHVHWNWSFSVLSQRSVVSASTCTTKGEAAGRPAV